MLQGMTGFGQAQGAIAGIKISLELRSYNHRYLDIVINAPNGFSIWEDRIRSLLKQNFTRGRIILSLHSGHYSAGKIAVNEILIKDYLQNLRRASKKFKIREDLSVRDFVSLPGVVSLSKPEPLKQNYWPSFERILCRVIKQLKDVRLAEGRSTLKDIRMRIKKISRRTEAIKKNAEAITEKKKRELAGDELSAYLKATDINEELLRLGSHVKNFNVLVLNPRVEAKGKELDFIAQELQREANTISAKSQDYKISECVVSIKAEIEKIREQLQNIQ